MLPYINLPPQEKSKIVYEILNLRNEGKSLRQIAAAIQEEHGVMVGKTTVGDIISRAELEEIEENEGEREIEYDDQNLYVYTSKIDGFGRRQVVRHTIQFNLINRIQLAYTSKGKNWTQQQILDFNRGTEQDPIFIKEKVRNAIKSATGLNKLSGIANEIFLKILYDKFGKQEVEGYLEELAHDTTRQRFREMEEKYLDKAFKKQYTDILQRDAKLETYLDKLSEVIKEYTPPVTLKPRKRTFNYAENLIIAFGDLHVGRTTEILEENMQQMLEYILASEYENITLINVGDNIETPLVQGMYPSQIMAMDYRGFDQILKAAQILEHLLSELYKADKNVEMFGINGNHSRMSKHSDDDPERLPELALYEIVKSRLHGFVDVTYFKNNVNTFTCGSFNIILSHGDLGFATKRADQIVNLKGSPFHYSIILNGHLHTPLFEQGSGRTRIQTPSMNNQDRYADEIILKESLPGFVAIETVNNLPQVTFINCMSE